MTLNQLHPFLLNQNEYRGIFVQLDSCYRDIIALHAYPEPMARLLGECLAAVSLLEHHLKQEGKLALQIQSDGLVKFCVAEMNHRAGIRGLIQWRDEIPMNHKPLATGKFAITVFPKQGEPYQGIIPLYDTIAKSLEKYFGLSEQIFSRILLAVNSTNAAGLFMQKLPDVQADMMKLPPATLNLLLDTLSENALLQETTTSLLHKLFSEQEVQLFSPEPVHFECTCNHQKMENAVRLLGKKEALAIFKTHPSLEVTCEFCNHRYAFDRKEVEHLF